jgi:small-conductance mechanosensitive channel
MKLIDSIEKTLASPSIYWQSLSLALCFIASYFFYSLIKYNILPKITANSNHGNEIMRIVRRYFLPILFPFTSIFFIIIGFAIFKQFYHEAFLFSTTIKLIALFLLLRFIRVSANSTFIANAVGIFLIPALILDIFGILTPTLEYLDELSFKIGKVKISIYLIIKAIIVLIIVFWLSSLISRKSKSYVDSNKSIKASTKSIISKFIDIIIYSIVAIIILKTFGFDMTTLAVIGGAVGVGIGFGLQKIASNFISGIILLFEKSVEVGDIVELENGSIYGTVKHFGGRYTLVECTDGRELMIPNEEFIINKVTNWTYSNNRARIEIKVSIAYGSDLEKVRNIIATCAKSYYRCMTYPEVECYITDFAESEVKYVLYFWINDITEGRANAKSDVMTSIYKKLEENQIKIPFPQRELRINKEL